MSNGNVAYNQEAYEAIGDGKYGIETSFAKYLNHLSSDLRENCRDRLHGIYELIRAGLSAREAYNFTGGNFSLLLLNGDGRNHDERFREYTDETGLLLTHIVMAREADAIDYGTMKNLLKDTLFSSRNRKELEREMFSASSDPLKLDLVLRGYKTFEITARLKDRKHNATTDAGISRQENTIEVIAAMNDKSDDVSQVGGLE
jgi:hypothetical protein